MIAEEVRQRNVEMEGGLSLSIGELLDSIPGIVVSGNVDSALTQLLGVCEILLEWGFALEVDYLLGQYSGLVTSSEVEPEKSLWISHIKARTFSRLGLFLQAEEKFQDVLGKAGEQGNRESIASANYYLANHDLLTGRLDQAARRYRIAFDYWSDLGDGYGTVRAIQALAAVVMEQGEFARAQSILDATQPIPRQIDPGSFLRFNHELLHAQIAVKLGSLDDALAGFRRAYRLARRTNDNLAICSAAQNLGAVYADRGDYRLAIRWLRRGIRIAEHIGAIRECGLLYRSLGVAFAETKRFSEAREAFEQARTHSVQVGDDAQAEAIDVDLGFVALQAQEYDRVYKKLEPALLRSRDSNRQDIEFRILRGLLQADISTSNHESMSDRLELVLEHLPAEPAEQRAELLEAAGAAYLKPYPPNVSDARDYFDRAINTLSPVPRTNQITNSAQASCAALSGSLLSNVRAVNDATHYFDLALSWYEMVEDEERAFEVRNDKAVALTNFGRYEEARPLFHVCLSQGQRLQNRAMEQQARFNLGEMAHRDGDYDDAIGQLEQSARMARELGDQESQAHALVSLGIAYLKADRYQEADQAFHQAEEVATKISLPLALAGAVGGLAGVAYAEKEYLKSRRLYRRAAALEVSIEDWHHAVQDLGGYYQSLANLGRQAEFDREIQQIVDIAQSHGLSLDANDALQRSGHDWLRRGNLQAAADSYAVGLALSINHLASIDINESTGIFAQSLITISGHAAAVLKLNTATFYDHLFASMTKIHPEFGESYRSFVEQSRQIVERELIEEYGSEEAPYKLPQPNSP